MVEYALLVTGIALICTAAVSILGHKTNDMLAAVAVVLPGGHQVDNNPIASEAIVEFARDAGLPTPALDINTPAIVAANNSINTRLDRNVFGVGSADTFTALILDQ